MFTKFGVNCYKTYVIKKSIWKGRHIKCQCSILSFELYVVESLTFVLSNCIKTISLSIFLNK